MCASDGPITQFTNPTACRRVVAALCGGPRSGFHVVRLPLAILVLTLFLSPSPAAPVPADPKGEQAKLDVAWRDLQSQEVVVRVRAALTLLDHPRAVGFLSEKLSAVRADKSQIRDWLTQLNSEDEAVRVRAYEQLKYFDPRLALSIPVTIGLVETTHARKLLYAVLNGYSEYASWGKPGSKVTMRTVRETEKGIRVILEVIERDGNSQSVEQEMMNLKHLHTLTWARASTAVVILGRINTPAARTVVERMAAGHPDALPTRTALACSQHGPLAPLPATRFETIWRGIEEHNAHRETPELFSMLDDPTILRFLRAKMTPIKADQEQTRKWLKQLGSDKESEWHTAFEQLNNCHPQLALTGQEIVDVLETDTARMRLYYCLVHGSPEYVGRKTATLKSFQVDDAGFTWEFAHNNGATDRITIPNLIPDQFDPPIWKRQRVALVLLERIGTADAKAVVTRFANGHPDLAPTKEAKAILSRWKK